MSPFPWRSLALPALLTALLLVGCPTTDDDDDDSAVGDDDDVEFVEGCIRINNVEPGFAYLADAMLMARDGDNVTLCAETFEGSATIDKSVTLMGASTDETVLVGAVNEMALTVTAPDVTIAHLTIQSTRNGIAAEGATGLTILDVVIEDSGQYGIALEDSQATIRDSRLAYNPAGGITAEHSTLIVEGTQLIDHAGYGIKLAESRATVTDSLIAGVVVPAETDDRDGTCIYADESTGPLTLDNVLLSGCQRVGVYTFFTDVDIASCAFEDSSNGVVAVAGGDDGFSRVADSYLGDVSGFGIYVVDHNAEVTGNTVIATNAGSGDAMGIAVASADGEFTVSDNEVAGYSGFGMYVQYPYDGSEPSGGVATVTGNTVRDGELRGLYVSGLDQVTLSDNTVERIAWSGSQPQPGTYDSGMGLGLLDIDELTMSGNRVADIDVVGVFLLNSEFTSTDDEITGTTMWGGYVSDAAGTFTRLNAHDITIYGIDARTAAVDYEECTFVDIVEGIQPSDWGGGSPYAFGGMGAMYTDSQGIVSGTTFERLDDYGVFASDSNVTVRESAFRDNYTGVYVNASSLEGFPVYIEDNVFGSHGWTGIYSYQGDTVVTGNVFEGAEGTGFYGSSFYGRVEDNTFTNAETAIQLSSYDAASMLATTVVEGNTLQGNATGLYINYWAGELMFEDNTFTGVTRGIDVDDYSPGDETIHLVDLTFVDSAETAIDLASVAGVTVSGTTTIDGCLTGPAIFVNGASATFDGVAVTGAAGSGFDIAGSSYGGSVTVANSTISGSVDHGVRVLSNSYPVTVALTDNTAISSNGQHGVELTGQVAIAITGNTIADNSAEGIACTSASVVVSDCSGNTLSGNGGGGDLLETNGCSLAACSGL